MTEPGWLESLRARANQAKLQEIAAHRKAIELHEDAAVLFDRLNRPDRAAAARLRADHARQLLALAIEEQAASNLTWAGDGPGKIFPQVFLSSAKSAPGPGLLRMKLTGRALKIKN